jgi:hypothetical protein
VLGRVERKGENTETDVSCDWSWMHSSPVSHALDLAILRIHSHQNDLTWSLEGVMGPQLVAITA